MAESKVGKRADFQRGKAEHVARLEEDPDLGREDLRTEDGSPLLKPDGTPKLTRTTVGRIVVKRTWWETLTCPECEKGMRYDHHGQPVCETCGRLPMHAQVVLDYSVGSAGRM